MEFRRKLISIHNRNELCNNSECHNCEVVTFLSLKVFQELAGLQEDSVVIMLTLKGEIIFDTLNLYLK